MAKKVLKIDLTGPENSDWLAKARKQPKTKPVIVTLRVANTKKK